MLRERTDGAWFSCLLRHPTRKRSGGVCCIVIVHFLSDVSGCTQQWQSVQTSVQKHQCGYRTECCNLLKCQSLVAVYFYRSYVGWRLRLLLLMIYCRAAYRGIKYKRKREERVARVSWRLINQQESSLLNKSCISCSSVINLQRCEADD